MQVVSCIIYTKRGPAMIIDLLRSNGSIVVNKLLAKAIGINAAIMYSELISKYIYFANKGQITEDGFFYNTVENMQEDTTLSKDQQLAAIKVLVKVNLIEQKNRGLPRTRHFKINQNEEIIKKILYSVQSAGNPTYSKRKIQLIDVGKLDTNNTKGNNPNNNPNEKEYIPYSEIIDHLNLKAETNYKSNSQKTKQLIKDRWSEGYILEDFKRVIDKKTEEWLNDEMAKYLRPMTLFGNKFEGYLNQKTNQTNYGEKGGKSQRELEAEKIAEDYNFGF